MVRGNRRRSQSGRGRASSSNSMLVPVAVLPYQVNYTFTESGGDYTLTAPMPADTESNSRIASVLLQYASPTPCVLTVRLDSGGLKQVETMPLQVSVTTRTLRLRMPRSVDYNGGRMVITSTGPTIVTGRIMFTYKGTYVEPSPTDRDRPVPPFDGHATAPKEFPPEYCVTEQPGKQQPRGGCFS